MVVTCVPVLRKENDLMYFLLLWDYSAGEEMREEEEEGMEEKVDDGKLRNSMAWACQLLAADSCHTCLYSTSTTPLLHCLPCLF